MFDMEAAKAALKQAVACLDPEVLEPSYAATLVEDFGEMERICAAGKALAARRVSSSGIWRSSGERSPAHWMAHKTGTSVSRASHLLDTAQKVVDLPQTDRALRSGELSETQAVHVASAAAASPSSEEELLQVAKKQSVSELKERCARVRAAALPDELARRDAIHRERYFRHFLDAEGGFRLDGRVTPEAGAVLLAALEPSKQRLATAAKDQMRREPHEAIAADALVDMAEHFRRCSNDPERTGPLCSVHVRVDLAALKRGQVTEGETCEISGVGPIPVASARALLSDSVLSLLGTDGADVASVVHLGRTIPSRLRTALVERDARCVVPGCFEHKLLEIDHTVGVFQGGETRLDNLGRLCRAHHDLKTYKGYRLRRKPDGWEWGKPKEFDSEGATQDTTRGAGGKTAGGTIESTAEGMIDAAPDVTIGATAGSAERSPP